MSNLIQNAVNARQNAGQNTRQSARLDVRSSNGRRARPAMIEVVEARRMMSAATVSDRNLTTVYVENPRYDAISAHASTRVTPVLPDSSPTVASRPAETAGLIVHDDATVPAEHFRIREATITGGSFGSAPIE